MCVRLVCGRTDWRKMEQKYPVHPRGIRAKVLLSSVFGPYAQDDEYGSRSINPMELYHNQVTRVQGGFSLRMFHRSFGLMLIQANIDAPCTLIDFPTLDRFVEEVASFPYDIVGISSIGPNVGKVAKMCELVREHQPNATIIVGGHIASRENLHEAIDADHIVRGEGIRWFRRYLGQTEDGTIRHPAVYSGFGARIMGVPLPEKSGGNAAILIPSVGCPIGCDFCTTSAMFGGKGNFNNFYETGDELFAVMSQIETELHCHSFFALDENFLLHRKRALRLLDLMRDHGKSWSLYVFSSAKVLESYTFEQLIGLGISWVWTGVEGKDSRYQKVQDVDTRGLFRSLQAHGIRVLGSSMIGMDYHTPETIGKVIDFAVSHKTDFHQFMLFTPFPGTALYERRLADGTLLSESEFPAADAHGQFRFNFRHNNIHNNQEEQFLLEAFRRDFEVNGPSIARLVGTSLNGWLKYKNHPEKRIRRRFAWKATALRTTYSGAVWAMLKWYRADDRVAAQMKNLLERLYREFGWSTRIFAALSGRYLHHTLKNEEKRLAKGWTYEPREIYQKNEAARLAEGRGARRSKLLTGGAQWITRRLPFIVRQPRPEVGS